MKISQMMLFHLRKSWFDNCSGSTPLTLQNEVFFGQSGVVKCGPTPSDYNSNWTAEWTCNGNEIPQDADHTIVKTNGMSELTISRFFRTDTGKKYTTWS